MNIELISIIESIYLYYMFRCFETTISFSHPLEFLRDYDSPFFKHPIETEKFPQKHICPFGQSIILLLILYLLARFVIGMKFNMLVLIISFILSLANFNAVVYLIPFFIIESIIFYSF